ncbi:MAG: hypothetical protein JWR78_922 [Mycobacterium sp.]|jgi:hypothetical protein|nr:hypothetical protein [Mycobacterium sp.]
MRDPIAAAVVAAAEHHAPPETFYVGPAADVEFGTGSNPFDGMQITHWSVD